MFCALCNPAPVPIVRCHDQVFDLFATLGATDEQLDFPTLYASARMGWAAHSWKETRALLAGAAQGGMDPILDTVVQRVKAPPPPHMMAALAACGWHSP